METDVAEAGLFARLALHAVESVQRLSCHDGCLGNIPLGGAFADLDVIERNQRILGGSGRHGLNSGRHRIAIGFFREFGLLAKADPQDAGAGNAGQVA